MESKSIVVLMFFMLVLYASHAVAYAENLPPKKQLELGIEPEDIVCRHGLILALRESGMPACVKPSTAERFEDRGWIIITKAASTPPEPADTTYTMSKIQQVSASTGTVNFYVTDQDLNLAKSAAETVSTRGLFEVTVNGVPIDIPDKMTETGFDTGRFLVSINLPQVVNGEPLRQGDIILVKYLDETGHSGDPQVLTRSFALSSSYARVEAEGDSSRIGREFTLRIYEPDANRDSRDKDRIPLGYLKYRGEGGIRTTLSNPVFDANSGAMIETGPNTDTFEVKIKIPREIDGKIVHIGDWYEITYVDKSTPSGTQEEVILRGKIG